MKLAIRIFAWTGTLALVTLIMWSKWPDPISMIGDGWVQLYAIIGPSAAIAYWHENRSLAILFCIVSIMSLIVSVWNISHAIQMLNDLYERSQITAHIINWQEGK